jgi:hypothetical protein
MDRPDEEKYVAPGPGLPAFVHRISGPGWVFVGLAVLVAIARLGAYGLLEPDRQWSLDDAFSLATIAGSVLLVLVPVVLLHRRPAAWSEDRMLAVAAIVVAARPVLAAITRVVDGLMFSWLTMGDTVDGGLDLVQPVSVLLAGPGWLVAIATPLLVVWGFDRLDDRPPARFPGASVVLLVSLVILLLAGPLAGALLLAPASSLDASTGSSWTIVNVVPWLAITAAWTWAALAALAGIRAGRGRWWLLLLVGVILAELIPYALTNLGYVLGTLMVESGPWSDVGILLWRPVSLLAAAGAAALAGAFASVPRAAADGTSRGDLDLPEPA